MSCSEEIPDDCTHHRACSVPCGFEKTATETIRARRLMVGYGKQCLLNIPV